MSPELEFQSFMTPLILNTMFIKRESNISYSQVSNWNPPDLEPTYSHNHYTMFNLQYDVMGSLKLLYAHLQSLGSASVCASALKIQTQRPEHDQIPTKPTTICLTIYKHSKHTKLSHSAPCCVGLWGRNIQQEQKVGLIY